MSYLSGAPLFCHSLCIELVKQGHDVTMMSDWFGPLTGHDGYRLAEDMKEKGVKLLPFEAKPDNDFDLIIASEKKPTELVMSKLPKVPIIAVVHSEYECETPIEDSPMIDRYVCIRPSILEHIVTEHSIPREKCIIVYNGVDRERFKSIEKTKRDFYKIVVPCTLDTLREPFLNKLIDGANEKRRIFFYGFDCGAKLHSSPYIEIHPDTFDIESEIADADEVAGILLGRVNLEAWSCGVRSSIYDPVTLESTLIEPPEDFDQKHNIKDVVKDILKDFVNLNDVTIVIPHHDQTDKLNRLLQSISCIRHVTITKGGSFSDNCNAGFGSVRTKYVLFLNDDTVMDINVLNGMVGMMDEYDIVGCIPSQGCSGFSIEDGDLVEYRGFSNAIKYPSGFCFMVKSEVFSELGMLGNGYKNGCEDIDFFLKAEEAEYEIGIFNGMIEHDEASSTGRFDHINQNIELFNMIWEGKCKINAM